MTEAEIKEALEICERATPGPWTTDADEGWGTAGVTGLALYGDCEIEPADARFIAHARTNYPKALKALQRIRALVHGNQCSERRCVCQER
jgi:hypothetical protein